MVAPAQMLGSSIQTTPAAMKQAVLDAATGGMSPTSKAKFIKYNCSDCGGDLMAGDGPGTDVTGAWRKMSHNKHWTKQQLAEARATWVRPNDKKTVVTVCTGSRCRKPLLPTAEQLERMQEYSLTIKQESDVRAAAARLPGDFVDAGDILDLLRMGM